MTIWKRVANIHGYRGGATSGTGQTDGSVKFGDHDTEEKIGRPSGEFKLGTILTTMKPGYC